MRHALLVVRAVRGKTVAVSIQRFTHTRHVAVAEDREHAGEQRLLAFRRLRAQLYLVATNLDTGKPIVFGAPGADHVPISRAIEASSALPGLFPPVAIDGEHYVDGALNKTLHASLALDAGADLLLCVNPLVPFDAPSAHRRGRLTHRKLDRGGLPLVLSQTFRRLCRSAPCGSRMAVRRKASSSRPKRSATRATSPPSAGGAHS